MAGLSGSLFGATLPVTGGLRLWLAADAINASDPNQVNSVGGISYLANWLDQSGGGFNATQATAGRQPIYVANAANSRAVLKFDGINDFLSTTLPQIQGDKSIFIVHKRINLPSPSGTELSTSNGVSGMFFGNNGGNETQGRISVAHDRQLPGLANDYVLKGYIRAGSVGTLLINDTQIASNAPDAATGNYSISDGNNFPYSGAIAEVLIYDRALTQAERQDVENYLSEKWGLWTNSLPVRSGLAMWLSAEAVNVFEPSQVTQNGNYSLNRWQSRGSTYRNAYQTTANKQPTVVINGLNNRPVIRFDGVNDVMTTALPMIAGNKSIFTVMKRTGTTAGLEISSTANGTNMFLGNNGAISEAKGRFSNGRMSRAYDLQVPMLLNQFVLKKYSRSGTSERLQVNDVASVANINYDFANGYYSISDGLGSPFKGDLAEVLIYNRSVTDLESSAIMDYLQSKWSWTPDNVFSVVPDSQAPPVTSGTPSPGTRVKQTVPAYADTNAYHTLYLPRGWQPGVKYPVIVEYAPNGNPVYTSPYGDTYSGKIEDISMGYGITDGSGFILIGMPTIGGNPLENQTVWWGDVAATKDYCLQAVRYVCEQYGGDPAAVILAGFSRGAIACNYLGLNDDTIADTWLAFIPHSHYDGQYLWGYPGDDQASAYSRLLRLKGRAQHLSHEGVLESAESYLLGTGINLAAFRFRTMPFSNHTDLWTLRPMQLRRDTRAWLQQILQERTGTHSIAGRVIDTLGNPVAGARIQSGFTHFTFTGTDGTYVLAGLIDSTRTVSATGNAVYPDRVVNMAGANLTNIDFQAQP